MNENFNKIIGIRFKNEYEDIILFGKEALNRLNKEKNYYQLISKEEFELMSRFDLGNKWGLYADNSPIIFELSQDTNFEIRYPNAL
jgi:hypothetical protein